MNDNMNSFVLRNGRILDPSQTLFQDSPSDLLVRDGKIVAIEKPGVITKGTKGPSGQTETIQEFDCSGLWIMPGWIDVHVHLREPGHEYKETIRTGTQAAVAGGFTSIACMANTLPVNDNPYVTAYIREKAKKEGLCRVFPVGAVSKGLKGEELAEIGGMVREGARAISDDGMPVLNSYLMRKAMDYSKAFNVPVISHAEDPFLVGQGVMNEGVYSNLLGLRGNPAAAEEIFVAREIALARLTGARVHIAHLSTRLGLEQIRRAKEEGIQVTAEVSPHHLTLTELCLGGYDTNFKMAPPLRTESDVEALVLGLNEGVIDMIATDHAPHSCTEKAVEFDQAANGITGLQTAGPVTYSLVRSGKVSLERWVSSLTLEPAKLLGLPYGTLRVGFAADITVFAPSQVWKLGKDQVESLSANTPFINTEWTGQIRMTFVDGKLRYGGLVG